MLDTASVCADPGIDTLGINTMIKMLLRQVFHETLMLHTYIFDESAPRDSMKWGTVLLNVVPLEFSLIVPGFWCCCHLVRAEMVGVQVVGI